MLVKDDQKTTFLARTNFRGSDKIFGIKRRDRRQHMYVVGKTGTGKTVLLKNMAIQDIRNGHGVGIIDPHGEFVEEVLEQIPEERLKDVIYFNPVDVDHPIGFNVLDVPDAKYKHLVVSDLLGIFTKIWANVWSARMEYILQNCILALLDTPGTTLLGIPRILVDKDYREKIIANVKDPVVRSFWIHEYETWRDQFRNEAIVPIQNKVGQFLNTSFIRNIVGQPTSTLNIPQIMNEGKILLVNVSKGKIGEDNSGLLGAMIITKIQLAAMERVRIAEDERNDFYMYVDEFQNFATDSFASILSEARKYRLNLIVAHQYIGQLVTDTSTKVRDAVFGNVGTMLVFRVGADDAEYMEKEFDPELTPQDLVNLPNHHIYLKLMVNGVTSRPFSGVTLPPMEFSTDPSVRDRVMENSRALYSRPREEVEARITKWSIAGEEEHALTGVIVKDADRGKMFETICSNCGKSTTVPFKPDGKRPAYCMECLRKIEAGTLIPLPDRMPQLGRTRFGDTLGALGIEFPAADIVRAQRHGTFGTGPASTMPQSALNIGSATPQHRQRDTGIQDHGYGDRAFNEPQHRERGGQRRPDYRPSARPLPPIGASPIRTAPVVRLPSHARPVSLSALKPRERSIADSARAQQLVPLPKLRLVESMSPAGQCPTGIMRSTSGNVGSGTKGRGDMGEGIVPSTPRNIGSGTVNIADLRRTLEEALKDQPVQKEKPRPEPEEKKVMQPGDAIKF